MVDEQKLMKLADQLICHPVSRSIEEIESAGEAIKTMLDELQTLREERTAWRVTAENAEKDAARYRWLREADPDSGGPYITRSACNDWGKWFNTVELQTEADAAIDAAMKDES